MNIELLGFSLDVLGKIMVAYTAMMIHYRFWKEHKVDEKVFMTMRREQIMGLAGIILIVAGYFLQLPSKI